VPDTLLIHIADPVTDPDHTEVTWCVVAERPSLGASPPVESGLLGDAAMAAAGRRVLVALSASMVTLTHATVPGGRRGLAAVPFALEEELADDVEDLHFALADPEHDGSVPVAVIDRAVLRRVVDALQAHGISAREIVADFQLLPLGESDEWEVWFSERDALVRQGRHRGLWCQRALLDTLLPRLIVEAGESAPTQITWFGDDSLHIPEVPLLADRVSAVSAVSALARGVNSPRINLLQGEFSPRQQLGRVFRPWRVPAVCVAACGWSRAHEPARADGIVSGACAARAGVDGGLRCDPDRVRAVLVCAQTLFGIG